MQVRHSQTDRGGLKADEIDWHGAEEEGGCTGTTPPAYRNNAFDPLTDTCTTHMP